MVTETEVLLSLLFRAPLIGVNPHKPEMLHAVTMDGIPIKNWPRTSTVESACGKKRLKLLGSRGYAVEWPPNVRSLPKGTVRCDTCHDATGRKRPRSRFVPRPVDA